LDLEDIDFHLKNRKKGKFWILTISITDMNLGQLFSRRKEI